MCNCNQRAAYASQKSVRLFNRIQKESAKIKLIQDTPLVLNGDVTGRMYVFRQLNDVIWVDRRDALSMKKISGLQIMT